MKNIFFESQRTKNLNYEFLIIMTSACHINVSFCFLLVPFSNCLAECMDNVFFLAFETAQVCRCHTRVFLKIFSDEGKK